jgi:hypothetical protein
MAYIYDNEVARQLEAHGIRPAGTTSPHVVREYLSDLYRYELRRLKARLLRQEFARASYFDRVVDLRMRYRLLSIPVRRWLTAASDQPADQPPC